MNILVTFYTTHSVLLLEKYAKTEKLPGRIMPVPRKFSASCGLSWKGPLDTKDAILSILEKYSIDFDKIYEIE